MQSAERACDSGKLEFFNKLGNVAATCEFKKNPDGSVTAKGELSGRLKSLLGP
jgi:hypothetical protein